MGHIALPIAESLRFSDFIVNTVAADLDDATARRRARNTAGASIAWVLGHLIHYRHQMLAVLGVATDDTFKERFADGATDGSDYPSLQQLVRAWNDMSARIVPTVERAPDAVFTAPLGVPGAPHGEKRVLDTMVFMMWHESYHLGQLGTLRAQFGLTPVATLAAAPIAPDAGPRPGRQASV